MGKKLAALLLDERKEDLDVRNAKGFFDEDEPTFSRKASGRKQATLRNWEGCSTRRLEAAKNTNGVLWEFR